MRRLPCDCRPCATVTRIAALVLNRSAAEQPATRVFLPYFRLIHRGLASRALPIDTLDTPALVGLIPGQFRRATR